MSEIFFSIGVYAVLFWFGLTVGDGVTGVGSPARASVPSSAWCPPSIPPVLPAPRARSGSHAAASRLV